MAKLAKFGIRISGKELKKGKNGRKAETEIN